MSGKKVNISYGSLLLFPNDFEYVYLRKGFFDRVKELSQSNQILNAVSAVYAKSKMPRIFATACLGKS